MHISHEALHEFHRKLHEWYSKFGRKELSWRQTKDPYRIYISEIMLQQTQVTTVQSRFYQPFLQKFPTLKVLGLSDVQEVIKAWEGLGYYNRATNIHKVAVLTEGRLPQAAEALEALPGIGKNTAHAIMSFAHDAPYPVMEANVRRVIARVFEMENVYNSQSVKDLWEYAFALLDRREPYDYNQAMMDIGATICTKTSPKCSECPLFEVCLGKKSPQSYPQARRKKETPIRRKHILVYEHRSAKNVSFSVKKRDSAFLRGMWGFMEIDEREALPKEAEKIGHVTQVYSHFKLEADVYRVLSERVNDVWGEWRNLQELKEIPLSKVDMKVVQLLEN